MHSNEVNKTVKIAWQRINFFRRATYILFPGSELVSCDTLKSFAAQAKIGKSFAARHGKLKSRESSFLTERGKTINCASLVNFKFSLYSPIFF
jgi:hypothetical protein